MKDHFDFKDLMSFAMFLLALLTFIYDKSAAERSDDVQTCLHTHLGIWRPKRYEHEPRQRCKVRISVLIS